VAAARLAGQSRPVGHNLGVPGGHAPRGASGTVVDPWPASVDAFDAALPAVYRYVYSSTGGDAALTDEVTAATFTAAARGFAAGDHDRMALGPLHDAARGTLARRARQAGHTLAGRARGIPGSDGEAGVADREALRLLPYRPRIVLALRFHDHLPLIEIAEALGTDEAAAAREVRWATDAFLAAAGAAAGVGDRTDDAGEMRLCELFATLAARPGVAFAEGLRDRLRAEARAAPRGGVRIRPPAAVVSSPLARAAATSRRARLGRAAGTRSAVAIERPHAGLWAGRPAGTLDADDVPVILSPARTGSSGGRAHIQTRSSPGDWALPAMIVTAAVVVALVLSAVGGLDGRERAAAPPHRPAASPEERVVRADVAGAPDSRLTDATVLAPPETVGGERPAPTTTAEVVARVRLGPGGHYMNGPYTLDAGVEGLWSAAVDDDGTWSALRVDPVTGETLAHIPIPGDIPYDRRHHGIALSGGYVWTPALPDGLFRIDAGTNTPSGIVAVNGGVTGAAMDGGDGAVWAIGNDSVLRRIDAATTDVTATALISEIGLVPSGVDVAYGRGTVWVTVADSEIRHLIGFDPLTLARRYHYALPALGLVSDAYELAADGDRVIITETWPGGVTVVDAASGRMVRQHRFATAGISVEGDRVWLLSPLDGQATVVSTQTGDLVATAGVPQGVETMVPTAEGGLWAAIPATGELVRLRVPG
jgi:DNA-directed RNA polymerase specialized sigma24 family protein